MKGADYIAINRITNRAGMVLAATGETCERVPADALGWLLEGGDICKAEPKAKAPKGKE